jgi:hypothetical protein
VSARTETILSTTGSLATCSVRWVTTSTVRPLVAARTSAARASPVVASRWVVGSSSTVIGRSARSARADGASFGGAARRCSGQASRSSAADATWGRPARSSTASPAHREAPVACTLRGDGPGRCRPLAFATEDRTPCPTGARRGTLVLTNSEGPVGRCPRTWPRAGAPTGRRRSGWFASGCHRLDPRHRGGSPFWWACSCCRSARSSSPASPCCTQAGGPERHSW